MATRVLSTEAAKSAITQVHAIVTGGLSGEISKLDQLREQLQKITTNIMEAGGGS